MATPDQAQPGNHIQLTLLTSHAQYIIECLKKRPYEEVVEIMQSISAQVQAYNELHKGT